MDDASNEPTELYRARGPAEAHALRIQLEGEGIRAHVDNEMLQGIVGEIPGGWVTAPRILVARADFTIAQVILDAFLSRITANAGAREADTLRCLACGSAMGVADTCPSCAWTYSAEGTPISNQEPRVESPSTESRTPRELTTELPAPTVKPGWGEVAAVLAVGVIPPLLGAITRSTDTTSQPYWADTVDLAGVSACTAFVCLYLIRRSGESWSKFGLGRPGFWDIPLGIVMLLVAEAVWIAQNRMGLVGKESGGSQFPIAHGPGEYAMMVVKYLISSFAEELVCRAYLITRLEVLLRSRTLAVVFSAATFASYHAYQGSTGVIHTFLLGLAYGTAFLGLRRIWPLVLGHAILNMSVEMSYAR